MARVFRATKNPFTVMWTGPHLVLDKLSDEVYCIKKGRTRTDYHVDDLRAAPPEVEDIHRESESDAPPDSEDPSEGGQSSSDEEAVAETAATPKPLEDSTSRQARAEEDNLRPGATINGSPPISPPEHPTDQSQASPMPRGDLPESETETRELELPEHTVKGDGRQQQGPANHYDVQQNYVPQPGTSHDLAAGTKWRGLSLPTNLSIQESTTETPQSFRERRPRKSRHRLRNQP